MVWEHSNCMKKKLCCIFIVFFAILIVVAIYFTFIRSWNSSLDADTAIDAMRQVSYFNNKSLSDYKRTLSEIQIQCKNAIDSDEIKTVNNIVFERDSDINTENNHHFLEMHYSFRTATSNEYKILKTSINVYIFTESNFSFSLCNGPEIDLPFNNGQPYLIADYNKEFGKFRPIFNFMSKHSEEDNFEYYTSPLISTKDDIGLPSFSGDGADLVFIYNDYTVYIHEDALYEFEHRYNDVIADLIMIFNQAKAAES